tara:strand:+ start:1442 stop:1582 length:141 start_codon:yes stop_codon:yes gene_type:complete
MDDTGNVVWLLSDIVVPDISSHNITRRFVFKHKNEIGNNVALKEYF